MAIKKYNQFINENSILDEEYRNKQKSQLGDADYNLLQRAKFIKGDKVDWSNGRYESYTIDYAFVDMGVILYNLINPQGISSGGRVREDELERFDDSMASIDKNESTKTRYVDTKCGKKIYVWDEKDKGYAIGVNGTSHYIGNINKVDLEDKIQAMKDKFEKDCN